MILALPYSTRRAAIAVVAIACLPAAVAAQGASRPASAPAPRTDAELLAMGRQYTTWFYTSQPDSLLAHMTEEGRVAAHGRQGIEEAMAAVATQAGAEASLVGERIVTRKGRREYWREAKFDLFTSEPLIVRWVLDDAGAITGVGMAPRSEAPPEGS